MRVGKAEKTFEEKRNGKVFYSTLAGLLPVANVFPNPVDFFRHLFSLRITRRIFCAIPVCLHRFYSLQLPLYSFLKEPEMGSFIIRNDKLLPLPGPDYAPLNFNCNFRCILHFRALFRSNAKLLPLDTGVGLVPVGRKNTIDAQAEE